MWVIDIRHWLDDTQSGPAVPQLTLKVKKLGDIIMHATSAAVGIPIAARPVCWRKPGRKPCKGFLEIGFNPATDQIHWKCPVCHDEGVVTGWEGLIWDMRKKPARIN